MNNFVNTSLFVGDLPKFCTEADLEQLFKPFGPTLDCKIKRNANTGKTLSYGFVTLANENMAAEALKRLDGTMFLGRKLRIRWAMYNAKTQNPTQQSVINSVYVRFVTPKVRLIPFSYGYSFYLSFCLICSNRLNCFIPID
jgi:RNA recognition motif-containing protein